MNHLDIRIPEDRGKLYTVITYPAGEIQTRLTDAGLLAVVKADSYRIIANPIPDVIELAQLNDAINQVGRFAEQVLFLPYMPFSRADRRFAKGDTFALAVYMNLLRTIGFTKIQTFDVHSDMTRVQAQYFRIDFENISPMNDIKAIIDHLHWHWLCIVLPDKGSISRYFPDGPPPSKVWKLFDIPVLFGDKVRDPFTGKLSGFKVDSAVGAFKKALIIDDICDGGGTFIGLGEEIKRIADPIDLYLYTSHGIYSQGEEKLKRVFKELFTASAGYNNGRPKEEL